MMALPRGWMSAIHTGKMCSSAAQTSASVRIMGGFGPGRRRSGCFESYLAINNGDLDGRPSYSGVETSTMDSNLTPTLTLQWCSEIACQGVGVYEHTSRRGGDLVVMAAN